MAVALYMDHHVPRAISTGLRLRGVDVITAYEEGTSRLQDPELLTRATELNRPLFTQDDDLLAEATRRQRDGISFSGVNYAHQLHALIGQCVRDLELIAKTCVPQDLANRVEYLPL
jgi:predicted nuclease of predicted toxin-antitoxin system